MCIARAPIRVAMASAVRAGIAVGSPLVPLARSPASRISSNMSRSLFDAAPSVPMPTLTPSSSIRAAGATPAPSLRLLVGLWATPALAPFNARISPSSTCTQCAARVVHFLRGLGEVDVQRHVELDGELRALAEDLRRAGVGRVRRRRRHDQ